MFANVQRTQICRLQLDNHTAPFRFIICYHYDSYHRQPCTKRSRFRRQLLWGWMWYKEISKNVFIRKKERADLVRDQLFYSCVVLCGKSIRIEHPLIILLQKYYPCQQ